MSTSENAAEEGDHIIAIVLKRVEDGFIFQPRLRAEVCADPDNWDDCLEQDLESMQKELPNGSEIVAVTHTARNVGNRPEQIIWYQKKQEVVEPDSNVEVYAKVFTSETGDWNDLMAKAVAWLNTNVIPHKLVSISMTEEHLPPDDIEKGQRLIVTVA